jgi:tetratricopeptide (TPR) repeat protein
MGCKQEKGLPRGSKTPAGLRMLFIVGCLVLVTIPLAAEERQAVEDQAPAGTHAAQSPAAVPQNSLNEAIDLAKQRIAAETSSEKALVKLGNLLVAKGSLKEAEETFDKALSLNGRYHDAMTGKGIVLARMGRDKEAEEMLQKALVLNPNPIRTYYELGLLYEKQGDFNKAVSEYKKGIEKYKQEERDR